MNVLVVSPSTLHTDEKVEANRNEKAQVPIGKPSIGGFAQSEGWVLRACLEFPICALGAQVMVVDLFVRKVKHHGVGDVTHAIAQEYQQVVALMGVAVVFQCFKISKRHGCSQ